MSNELIAHYGVHEQNISGTNVEKAAEQIRLLGYAIVDSGYDREELAALAHAFDGALQETHRRYGLDILTGIDEHNTIRAPLALNPIFLRLAMHPAIVGLARELIGPYVILNQQNGIINPSHAGAYNQQAYHRDLPYQHFVSSRPLAINALFCLDPFTRDNGATLVIPGSHRSEELPSDDVIRTVHQQPEAPAGSFLVLDAMTFHSGGLNRTAEPRRAVNHVYSIPLLRQQIDLPAALGPDFVKDREIRKLLGYEAKTPISVEAYHTARRAKLL